MSVIITTSAVLGPFKSVEVLTDRLRCDNTDLPFNVIGSYTISQDDSLAPPPPAPPVVVPTSISMRQARLALLGAGMLAQVDAAIAGMAGAAGDAARIEWEYATTVDRTSPLVAGMTGALSLTSAQLDALFIAGAAL